MCVYDEFMLGLSVYKFTKYSRQIKHLLECAVCIFAYNKFNISIKNIKLK